MQRKILTEDEIHPAVREKIERYGSQIIEEVKAAAAANHVLVVGMRQNPFPKKARRLLDSAGIFYKYLEYGSYFSGYRRRLPLKLWTGWSTFPMIFVKGVFIGGAQYLQRLIASAELASPARPSAPTSR